MNSQLSLLVRLQRLDLKLHDLEQQQQRIPRRLHEAQAPIDLARQRQDSLQASLETLTAERRREEQDLSDHECRVAKIRDRLNELKTNKEYQAHLFEIELAGKKKDALEEQILHAMDRAEVVGKELEDVRASVRNLTRDLEQEKSGLESLGATLTSEIAAVDHQKHALLDALDQRVCHRYAALKASLKLVVVAPVRGGTCMGCHLQIPPQLVASVRRADELLTCPYCHRILYAEDAVHDADESPEASPSAASDDLEGRMAGESGNR